MQCARASIGLVLSRVRCLVILEAFAKYDCQRQNLGNKAIEDHNHWSTHLITKDLQKKICSLWLTKDNKLKDSKGFPSQILAEETWLSKAIRACCKLWLAI